jgi:hypothetical protein
MVSRVGCAAKLTPGRQLGADAKRLALTLDSKGIIIPNILSFYDRDNGGSIHRIMYAIEHNTVSTQVASTVKNERRYRHRPALHSAFSCAE